MVQRVLAVTFAQALRSAGILLLPLAFITLIAWATAGSTTGTTSDPIRAAMWIWLAAHHVHFDLSLSPSGVAGSLTYLPLGALIFPALALRSGFKRAVIKLDGDYSNLTGARLFFSLFYAIVAFLIAFFSGSDGVRPVWPLAAIFAFLIAFASTHLIGRGVNFSLPVIFAFRVVALLLALGFAIFVISFFRNFDQGVLITTVLAPGIFGSILLLILNIVYLPNAAIAALSYQRCWFCSGRRYPTLTIDARDWSNSCPAAPCSTSSAIQRLRSSLFTIHHCNRSSLGLLDAIAAREDCVAEHPSSHYYVGLTGLLCKWFIDHIRHGGSRSLDLEISTRSRTRITDWTHRL
jgi:hypothetical protein